MVEGEEELKALRGEVESVTLEIVRLMGKRIKLAQRIGELKKERGLSLEDPQVERALRRRVLQLCREEGLNGSVALRILNQLIKEAIRVQGGEDPSANKPSHMQVFAMAKRMEAQGKEVIHLEIGEPDFPPPILAKEALYRALEEGRARYTESRGIPELRKALVEHFSKETGRSVEEGQVIVTPGGRFAVYLAIASLIKPGDEAIIIEPSWPAYKECVEYVGGRAITLSTSLEKGWSLDLGELEELINESTKLMILNYPNNPTGRVLDGKSLQRIVNLAASKGVMILSDEVYSYYSFTPFTSLASLSEGGWVIIKSFSKSYSMTGFRVGYAIADAEVIANMAKIQSLLLTSIPEFIQYAAIRALDCWEDVRRNVEIVRRRVRKACDYLRRLPMSFREPEGGMYVFAKIDEEGFDGGDFSLRLLQEKGVAVAPGVGFGRYPNFLRLSFCTDDASIMEGLRRLGELLCENRNPRGSR